MRIVSAPLSHRLLSSRGPGLRVVLFGQPDRADRAAAGGAMVRVIQRAGLAPSTRAWDFLSIALSVIAVDTSIRRGTSPDGWTREIELEVAVGDADFWATAAPLLQEILRMLTTDIWSISFVNRGATPPLPRKAESFSEDSVALLSGGLDSLVGAIDLTVRSSKRPFLVSQIAVGDGGKQRQFAAQVGAGLRHMQLNHNATSPGTTERSQRSRSLGFLAYGVVAASSLDVYRDGGEVVLYVCENGFISINPPLTPGRLGSLSTRTTHPLYVRLLQDLFDAASLRIRIENPYQLKTKGEMVRECVDQKYLRATAHLSTSCGRFGRNGYQHCGRCIPCLIRRASFRAWGVPDRTGYVYRDLGRNDRNHAQFDDVRAATMAIVEAKADGVDQWIGASLSSERIADVLPLKDVAWRGLLELEALLLHYRVK